MASATAGPSSPPSRSSSTTTTTSPPRASTTSPSRTHDAGTRTIQMNDSPLREGDSFASYGSGGHGMDLDSSPKRGGHGDLGETVIYSRRRASDRKGKGRAIETTDRLDEVRIPVEAEPVIEEEEDEEAEAKRIEANLAKWSKADAERRAALRRSSRLVQTTIVAPPPIPGASDLIRKTSTLLRTASQKRRTSGGAGRRTATGLTEEELELAAAGQTPLRNSHGSGFAQGAGSEAGPSSPSLASRREQRKMSLRLDSNVDLTSPVDPSLRSAGTARSERSVDHIEENSSTAEHFSPAAQQTLRQARGGSVFIENLPPLPQTPSAVEVSRDPFATPQVSPVKASATQDRGLMSGMGPLHPVQSASSSFAPGHPENPFIDVFVTSPSPAKYPTSRAGPQSRSRPASDSQQSLVSAHSPPLSPSSATGYPYGASASMTYSGRPPSPAYSSSSNPASPLQGSGPRRRRSYEPRIDTTSSYHSDSRHGPDRLQEPEAGWLSWLLCGCLRPENDDDGIEREVLEQRGRTNPNE